MIANEIRQEEARTSGKELQKSIYYFLGFLFVETFMALRRFKEVKNYSLFILELHYDRHLEIGKLAIECTESTCCPTGLETVKYGRDQRRL